MCMVSASFSANKALKQTAWENTRLATGDFVNIITQLKNEPGNDIIVYGGANFVSALIKQSLLDELYLFTKPVALGKGS